MRVAFGTDETTELTGALLRALGDAGHEVVLECVDKPWPQVGRSVDAVYKALAKIRQALFDCVTRTLAQEGLA